MEKYEKIYVEMLLRVSVEGEIKPVAMFWQDGVRYEVTRVRDVRMAPPRHVGAVLTRRYECEVEGYRRELYVETMTNRWFVEKRIGSD